MIECVPPDRAVVAQVACHTPAVKLKGWAPQPAIVVASEANETLPLPSVGETVAEKVTDWPKPDGSTEEGCSVVAVWVRGDPATNPTPWK